jgi:hypothetical protein
MAKYETLIKSHRPVNLTNYCIRIVLNKDAMLMKNITPARVFNSIKYAFSDLHIIYDLENNFDYVVMRLYMPSNMNFGSTSINKETNYLTKLRRFIKTKLLTCIINGLPNVLSTMVEKTTRTYVDEVSGTVKSKQVYRVITAGSNLAMVLDRPEVDVERTGSNVLPENHRIYGHAFIPNKILSEMRQLLQSSNVDLHHYYVCIDLMCFYPDVGVITRRSLAQKERDKILLRASHIAQLEAIKDGAYRQILQPVNGVSDAIILGFAPNIGSYFNEIGIDIESFMDKKISDAEIMEML